MSRFATPSSIEIVGIIGILIRILNQISDDLVSIFDSAERDMNPERF